ncbi:MAG TPA: hypothetical protein GXX26_04115 [Clostridiaceae bacterium]|nr:hypothetical protein [Clostridiaceae bacterium]
MTQYRIELVRILKSVIYLLMVAGIVLFALSQRVLPPDMSVTEPEPGRSYGMKPSNDPSLIMPQAAGSLFAQYSANKYITYPNGFYKVVRLNQEDRKKMAGIVAELSIRRHSVSSQKSEGPTERENEEIRIKGDDLRLNDDGNLEIVMPGSEIPEDITELEFDPEISWDRFKELMAQADKLLGGGSDFSEVWMSHRFGLIPVTYVEALADYHLVISHDRLTGAYARLFSDYMGIILGLLPVFPAVFLALSDRKDISPVLYTRSISSARFILERFFALTSATMLPIILMGTILTFKHAGDYGWVNIDPFAYFRYAFFWLLPTAIAAISVGMFFTTLTNTPIAIAIQLIWWFADISGGKGMYTFFGVRPIQLIPRHNGLGHTEAYLDYLPDLIQNRIRIMLVAVFLITGTIFIFSARRRGSLYVPVFARSKIRPEV